MKQSNMKFFQLHNQKMMGKQPVRPVGMLPLFGMTKSQREALQLELEESRPPNFKENLKVAKRILHFHQHKYREINRYWLEKWLVIVEAFQMFGIIWQLSQPWPWPARWLKLTRWTLLFNLDFVAMLPKGAAMGATSQSFSLWGEMHQYWMYALGFSSLPWVACTLYMAYSFLIQKIHPDTFTFYQLALQNHVLLVLQFLYLPIGLAVFRLWNCNADNRLSIDPSLICWENPHREYFFIITVCMGGIFLIGFPLLLWHKIHRFLIYADQDKHEHFVQRHEFEYMVGTSKEYILLSMPLHASFRRSACHHPVLLCYFKLLLLLIFTFLRPIGRANVRESSTWQGLQGSLFFVLFFVFALYRTCLAPFRVLSTHRIMHLVDWLLAFNGLYAALGAHRIRSAFTVASSVLASLSFIHTCCAIYFGYLMLHLSKQYAMWKIGWKQNQDDGWPVHVHMAMLLDHAPEVEEWVNNIQQATLCLEKAYFTPKEMKPIRDLAHFRDVVSEHCQRAGLLSHLMHDQLYDLSQELTIAYVEASVTTLMDYSPEMERTLGTFKQLLDRREEEQRLYTPKRRQMFTQLLSLQTWKGDRDIAYTYLENSNTNYMGETRVIEASKLETEELKASLATEDRRKDVSETAFINPTEEKQATLPTPPSISSISSISSMDDDISSKLKPSSSSSVALSSSSSDASTLLLHKSMRQPNSTGSVREEEYSPAFLKRIEWDRKKLYLPVDVEDWKLVAWQVALFDSQGKEWIDLEAIEHSLSEKLLKLKVPRRAVKDVEEGGYFMGFLSYHTLDFNSLRLVQCFDAATLELFEAIQRGLEPPFQQSLSSSSTPFSPASSYLEFHPQDPQRLPEVTLLAHERGKGGKQSNSKDAGSTERLKEALLYPQDENDYEGEDDDEDIVDVDVDVDEKLLDDDPETIDEMIQQTQKLLRSSGLPGAFADLSKQQRQWKQKIQAWEENFRRRHRGREASNEEKRVIRVWYEQYQALKKAAKLAEALEGRSTLQHL